MTKRPDTLDAPRVDSMPSGARFPSSIREVRGASVALKNEMVESLASDQKRFARLLHDTLAQSLTAARIHARLAKKKLTNAPGGAPVLDELERILESSVEELQFLMRWLRAPNVDSPGLVPALRELTALASTKVPAHFEPPRGAVDADRSVELELFRVAQLTLLDVLQRRTAESVTVALRTEEDGVVLSIHECGGDVCSETWVSLLEAEVEAIGGALAVQKEKRSDGTASGTRLVCRLPKHL